MKKLSPKKLLPPYERAYERPVKGLWNYERPVKGPVKGRVRSGTSTKFLPGQ